LSSQNFLQSQPDPSKKIFELFHTILKILCLKFGHTKTLKMSITDLNSSYYSLDRISSNLAEDLRMVKTELRELYAWVDSIPLSRPKKHIARDFSDGGMFITHFLTARNY